MSSSSDVHPGPGAVGLEASALDTTSARTQWAKQLRIRRIAPGDPLGDVLQLRREVYFQERGLQPDADVIPHRHSRRVTDGLDASGTTLVVESNQQGVATLRLHDFSSLAAQVEYGSLFQLDAFARSWPLHALAVATRFAVQADQRAKPVVQHLFQELYRWGHESGIRFCMIACEPFLHDVFEHFGFREYLPPAILPGGVDLLRMVLVMEEAPRWLERSARLDREELGEPHDQTSRHWLERTFSALR
ncbi:N-acyl amino acid synthase FeeM domain-containing protein [Pseudoxanthomonas dokdonensis]|uniref:N-acetyltransferase domain-containing protein n=1 Tax=Pseudoxanthomonas dokdonensis TaxID=344882 RepID=A0A0R0CRI7_9GAMM|nr:GNAT family N-acyltransferase [Pseudoxanthomonas dokdonensis]KRG68289.1 hypothetical protein ABB29_13245 [Pseudoxanthomonas dokdonensis]